ncbi:hypothetical protein LIER_29589 [Lithospermum erythrorhizon]|uniref:Glycine-rich protein n=1 Tax=Lithospermum erythrorhizon TaxID=34254 RepID=A0AAV3RN02_LITER
MKINITLFLAFLVLFATLALSTRPDPLESSKEKSSHKSNNNKGGVGSGGGSGYGGFFGPDGGFNIPGFGPVGGGYGAGFGGPKGGYGKGGVIRPSMVCKDKGPCYKKKVTCPAKCFSSFSRSGKGYGSGGGGGGCTIDCKKRCVASCS